MKVVIPVPIAVGGLLALLFAYPFVFGSYGRANGYIFARSLHNGMTRFDVTHLAELLGGEVSLRVDAKSSHVVFYNYVSLCLGRGTDFDLSFDPKTERLNAWRAGPRADGC
jgi:hypothetical protein